MKKDSRYPWYIVDTILFLALNILIIYHVGYDQRQTLSDITWTEITILALGVFRLTDIITHEKVTEFIRVPFMDRSIVDGKEVWDTSQKGLRGVLGTLVSCNMCMGVWVSAVVFYSFIFFPIPTLIVMFIMTLTCFERFLSKIYNFLEKRG